MLVITMWLLVFEMKKALGIHQELEGSPVDEVNN